MSNITVRHIAEAVQRVRQTIATRFLELNAADARVGDGDTGSMLLRLTEAVGALDLHASDDVGSAFSSMAKAAMKATGSSLGTLMAIGLLSIGKQTQGLLTIDTDEWPDLLRHALDAMMTRGGASLGDKTVLDSIFFLVELPPDDRTRDGYVLAARSALDTFRNQANKVGRARMFGEATVGLDDPGMLAFSIVLEAALSPALEFSEGAAAAH